MPSLPKRLKRDEQLWYEYDAYAKLENTITFLISDLTVLQEYIKSNPAPFPLNLVKQFAQDLKEFKEDADLLKKEYAFSDGKETALMIWNEQDPLSHHTVGELVHARRFSPLRKALLTWAQTNDDIFSQWKITGKDQAPGLTSLGEASLRKMLALLKRIDQSQATAS